MNYLIIILLVFAFTRNKSNENSGFLGGLEFSDVAPILNLLEGSNLLGNFNLSSIQNILNGEFNFAELLPLITSIFSSKTSTVSSPIVNDLSSSGLEPIKDLFDGDFYNALENYFDG